MTTLDAEHEKDLSCHLRSRGRLCQRGIKQGFQCIVINALLTQQGITVLASHRSVNAAKTCVVDCFEMGSEEMSPHSGRSSPGWLQFPLSNGQLVPFEGASALKWLTCSLAELGTNRMGAASSVKSREAVKVGRWRPEPDQDVCCSSRVVNGIAQGAEIIA